MEEKLFLAIGMAILASLNMNLGKALQKWKVKTLALGKAAFAPEHRRDLAVWAVGVLLTASAAPLFSVALNHAHQPALVSSMNGVGMIGLVLFAGLVLHERIGKQELFGAACVFAGTTLMGALEAPAARGRTISVEGFVFVFCGALLILGPAAWLSWRTRRAHGLSFGVLVGFLLGSAVVLGKLALVEAGDSFSGQFSNPYPYLALLVATAALAITQLAFWRSPAMVVVPTMNSVMILTPALLQYFALSQGMRPMQLLAVAFIVAGVILLTATEKADKLEGKTSSQK